MADPGKTEKATPKRRGEARNKGQVAKSADLSSTSGLLAACAALIVGGPRMLTQLEAMVTRGLAQSGNTKLATPEGLTSLSIWGMKAFASAIAPIVLAALITGLLVNFAQVKLKITPAALQPNFKRLNPGAGLKRLFGTSGLVETLKALAKLVTVGGMAFLTLWPKLPKLGSLVGAPPASLMSELGSQVTTIVIRVGGILMLLAVLDWFWQRHKLEKSLKMSKAEVKQEARQADLAPELRGAIKRKQFQAAKRRMLADVPTADVVIVNPTHFAVALRYDGAKPAPELVAKGVDHVAAAIRAAAEEHGVPIVTDPPLARAVYRQVDLGAMIPEELFAGVAEVLAYVYRISGRRTRARRREQKRIDTAALNPGALNPAPEGSIT
jgi:flagellar biosynthetic protein FlhB